MPFQKISGHISNWLFPGLCTLCDAPGLDGIDICSGCLADLPWNHPACLHCALPLPPDTGAPSICGACLKAGDKASHDQVWAAFVYKGVVAWLITHLKFHDRLGHARLLGDIMWQQLEAPLSHQPDSQPDLIIPVPLYKSRLKERGFNQSLEIARPISVRSGIKLETDALQRVRNTQRQSELSRIERQRNLRNAFNCKTRVGGKHVVLIDDVMTSGSTIQAAALAIKQAGARRISVWVAARAAPHAI